MNAARPPLTAYLCLAASMALVGSYVGLSAHDRRLLFRESFLGNFLFSIFMLFGVAATSAVAAGVVMAANPAAIACTAAIAAA